MPQRIPWVFTDPITSDVYELPVNPNSDSGSNAMAKAINYSTMSGLAQPEPDTYVPAAVINSKGMELEPFKYSGNIYTDTQLLAFEAWMNKDYPIQIEDDLGRVLLVILESFEISRVRSRQHRWKHTYTLTGTILEEL